MSQAPEVSPFAAAEHYKPATTIVSAGVQIARWFDDPAREYAHATAHVGLFDRADRGLIIVRGADRASWLHNLLTQDIRRLQPGQGAYSFAIDVRGRVIFDANVLVLEDAIWLDLSAAARTPAAEHLERYHIMEDVTLEVPEHPPAQLYLCGPGTPEAAAALGLTDFERMTDLEHRPLADGRVRAVRLDLGELPGLSLLVPRERAADVWQRVAGLPGVRPAGYETLDVLRIEQQVPWFGRDIDAEVLPPETGPAHPRGVSYNKGCYLGQEVLERMRSRGSLGRRLVRVALDDGEGLALPAPLTLSGRNVGRITSLVRHPARDEWIGLGYLATTVRDPTGLTAGDPPRPVRVGG